MKTNERWCTIVKLKCVSETPATATQYVFFDTDAIHQTNPSSISMRWDWRNLTANANSYVNITLWGYRETTIRPELVLIDILQVHTNIKFRYYF